MYQWFASQQQQDDGSFEDTEDTALAILALSSLAKEAGMSQGGSKHRISPLIVKKQCFIGYSGKASSIALALREYITDNIPEVNVIDWKLRFEAGHLIFEEIKDVCEESHAAIFLVTKDNKQIDSPRSFHMTPRDNIIFEIGYFSAKIGEKKTILIVEGETKLPTDLGGIIYIPMPDREELDGVKMSIDKKLRKILQL